MVMVRMARFPVGKDDRFGAKLTNDGRQAKLMLARGLNVRVGNAERAAPAYFEKFCGLGRFARADFRSSARTHFSHGQIENAGFVAALRHFQQRAATSQLHIDRKSTRLNSSHLGISYAVFCLKKKKTN